MEAIDPTPELEREAAALGRFLAGVTPSRQSLGHYARLVPIADAGATSPALVDHRLLAHARHGAWSARVADAYARFFRPQGVLRRRVVLMFAILENSPEGERALNSGVEGGAFTVLVQLLRAGVISVVALAWGVLRFGVPHLLTRTSEPT